MVNRESPDPATPEKHNRAEANLSALIESTEDLIWSVDLDYRLITFNRAVRQNILSNFGVRVEVGQRPLDFLPPERAARWPALYDHALDSGPFRTEYSLAEGRTIEFSLNPVLVDGKATGISVFGKDITEHIAAEASRRFLAEIVESSEDGIIAYDPAGIILTWNRGAEIIFGYPAEEAIGKPLAMVVVPERRPSVEQYTLELLQGEAVPQRQGLGLRKDGGRIYVSVTAWPIRDSAGTVTAISIIVRDVSIRREAEEARALLASIVESSSDAIHAVNLDGTVVSWNRGAELLFGYASKEIIGRNIAILAPPGRGKEVAQLMAIARKSGAIGPFETVFRAKDGRDINLSLSISPIKNSAGGVVGASAIARDITRRKRAEDELRESRDSLRDAQIIGGLGSYVLDVGTGIWTSSNVMDEIFGIDAGYIRDVEGWAALIHPDDRGMMTAYFEKEVVGQNNPFDKEYRVIRQTDGAERWVHGKGRLEFDAQGRPVKMRGVIRDITERKRGMRELEASEARFRRFFEENGSVMLLIDPLSGWICDANEAAAEYYGFTRQQLTAMSVDKINTAPSQVVAYERQRALREERRRFNFRHRLASGEERDVEIYASPMEADDKQLLFAIVHDVSERTRVEVQLRESEERYRATFQMSLDAINVNRLSDGVFIDVNEAFLRFTGCEREDVIGHTSQELNFWVDPADRQRMVETLLRTSSCRDLEARFRKKSGEIVWGQVSESLIHTADGPCILSVTRDISAAKAADELLAAAMDALRASEAHYRTVFQTSLDGICISQLKNGAYIDANDAFLELLGYEREEVIGHSSLELSLWADPDVRREMAKTLGQKLSLRDARTQFIRKNGDRLWIQVSASPIEIEGLPCVLSVVRDITATKAAEERLAEAQQALLSSETRYRTAFQTSLDAININRLSDGSYVDCNRAFLDIVGYERHEVIGRTSVELEIWANPRDRRNMVEMLQLNASCRNLEAQFKKKNGEIFWGQMSASVIEVDGAPCILSITRDISTAKMAEEEIRNLAFYDTLTGLPNRRLVSERLRQSLAASSRSQRRGALLFIDLDDFKTLNDTLGHRIGDLLLQEVARRLTGCTRDSDTVARLGGDEFVVILEDLSENQEQAASHAKLVAEKILAAVRQTYLLEGHECLSSSSIGITVFGERTDNIDDVLQQADIAMYQAKAAGRNTLHFFAPALQTAISARASLEEDLRQAIGNGQFQLYYQPQVESGALVGAEALVRWHHPLRGLLAPGEFIRLAEETGLIQPLGDWVLETACRQMAEWSKWKETAHITIAVNISARQLRQPDFVDQVLRVLDRTGANPKNLDLELTESMLVENIEEVIAKMTRLKAQGLRFSLDDFGTGYSSLSYLKRLPLNQLKIDRSFVHDMLVDFTSGAIARTIISLGNAMRLSVIAEGVETEQQRDFLASLGCHAFQGYLFSPPLPLRDFQMLLPDVGENVLSAPA
jgi:diguanylate cyclase (GGDEF)-like protein/PAS domain S-box-containing protein